MHNGWERTDASTNTQTKQCPTTKPQKPHHEPAERPIHVENESNCQDRVYWKFCQRQCTLHDVNARVAKFNCTEEVKKESMKEILTLDQCDYEYHQVKWIDCYCKPNGTHTDFVVTISLLSLMFIAFKFASYFIYKFKKRNHQYHEMQKNGSLQESTRLLAG